MLKPGGASGDGDEALEFYAKHTAQIEVKHLDVYHEIPRAFGSVISQVTQLN